MVHFFIFETISIISVEASKCFDHKTKDTVIIIEKGRVLYVVLALFNAKLTGAKGWIERE